MFEQREVITLMLGVGVVLFVIRERQTLKSVRNWHLLLSAFLLLFLSLTCSVVEVLIWEPQINLLQHIASALSAIALAAWCWFTLARQEAAS
jgi:hypothetical protein